MGLLRTVKPANLAVDLDLAKKQVEIATEDSTHDEQITKFIKASTDIVERHTRRALITQQFRMTLDCMDDNRIYLPRPPAVSIQSVQYRDADDNWQTYSSSYYTLLNEESPASVYFEVLPVSNSILPQSYRINYTAGYGDTHEDVDDSLKQVIYELVAFKFLNRGDVQAETPKHIMQELDALKCGARLGFYEMVEDD